LVVQNEAGLTVRTFSGANANIPAQIEWDGKTDSGGLVSDGPYHAKIEISYIQGTKPSAQSRPFRVDTVAPDGTVSPPYTIFSPNGDGRRDTLPLNVSTSGADIWTAQILDSKGVSVRSWAWSGKELDVTWDGADDEGNKAADGAYSFVLESSDDAGNATRREVKDIVLDARVPRVFFTKSASEIAPVAGGPKDPSKAPVVFNISNSLGEGIAKWSIVLKNDDITVKTFPESGAAYSVLPSTVQWDGKNESGAVTEGRLTPTLTIEWTKGDLVEITLDPVMVDITPPELSFASQPEFFSPDNDGVDDDLFIALGIVDASPIASWKLEISEPDLQSGAKGQAFWRVEGKNAPQGRLIWDGRSNIKTAAGGAGELAQAATDYPFILSAQDSLGNASSISGKVGIDVLVIRDGDNLKIAVPSIVFRANAADFNGLRSDVVAANDRVLKRIAQILNKFRDYKITVEGHANPTTAPDTREREREETENWQGSPPSGQLSRDRAEAVIKILVRNGVSASRLTPKGVGGTKTVVPWNDRDNNWKNRRVEFILVK
jgi:outer membrane protein OmpA-like peptidoglycan-associated protein